MHNSWLHKGWKLKVKENEKKLRGGSYKKMYISKIKSKPQKN